MLSTNDNTSKNDSLQIGCEYFEDSFITLNNKEDEQNGMMDDMLEKEKNAINFIKNKLEKEKDIDFNRYTKRKSKYKKRVL